MDFKAQNVREILKLPKPPQMETQLIAALTDLCFFDRPIQSSELLFVFGSNILHKEIARKITTILNEKKIATVLITGGIADYQASQYQNQAEAELILSHVPVSQFSHINFITETRSKNTLENVINASQLYNLRSVRSVTYFSHSYASMRSFLTLSKYCSAAHFYNYSIPILSTDQEYPITRENWHRTDYGRSLIWGEFLRFDVYGLRGDFPVQSVLKKIKEIKFLTRK